MFVVQIICGIGIDGILIGIIYTKLTRPPRKPYYLKFSRKAIICLRNSEYALMFRVCDPNELHIIGSRVKAYLYGEIMYEMHKSFERWLGQNIDNCFRNFDLKFFCARFTKLWKNNLLRQISNHNSKIMWSTVVRVRPLNPFNNDQTQVK